MYHKGFRWFILVMMLVLTTPIQGSAYWQAGSIEIGDTVEVVTDGNNLNLRSAPGLNTSIVEKLPPGTRLKVIDGPQQADNYTWWKLDGSQGPGWAAANFLRVVEQSVNQGSENSTECEKLDNRYEGVQLCTRDQGATQAVVIDLNDPHVRFETIMAGDATRTNVMNDSIKETIPQMAARIPDDAAVINSDYSGSGHGPEGLTIKNGERFDGIALQDDDYCAVRRSNLVISRPEIDGGSSPIHADIIRLENDRQPIDSNLFYTVSGGGPQVIFNGIWEWERGSGNSHYIECGTGQAANDIINGECFSNSGYWDGKDIIWTAIGINGKNQMIWVIGTRGAVQNVFSQYAVTKAIKMDGGGSSQLVYADETIVRSSDYQSKGKERVLASSLAVYYLYSFEVIEQPQWPVIVEGQSVNIQITLKNTGSDTWTQKDYRLVNFHNPLGDQKEIALPKDVKPGETVTLTWPSDPVDSWRIYPSRWVMKKGDLTFPGDAINFQVVVLPKKLAEKQKEIERKIQEWIQQGIENLEQKIMEEIQKMLGSICPLSSIGLPFSVMMVAGWRYQKRRTHPHSLK